MNLRLTGKSALITGSSRGIGLAIAQILHAEGCQIALNGRSFCDLAKATASLAGSVSIQGDVTQPLEANRIVTQALKIFGCLDILVCNVGSGRAAPPGQETHQELQRMFAMNLWSTTNTVEAAKDALTLSRGSIVCISSICGAEVVLGAPVAYSAAKAALHAFVRGIARPLGKQGVRINAVVPGNILFEGSIWSKRLLEDEVSVQSMLKREVSLGCLGLPVDVANLVAFLASPISHFTTGSIFTVDGGQRRS